MNKDNNQTNLFLVTCILILLSVILRTVAYNTNFTTRVVSFINILMLLYVVYRILFTTYNSIIEKNKKDDVSKNQIKAIKKLIRLSTFLLIFFIAIYLGSQFIVNETEIYSFINDIIAIITFGISIEEENIESKLFIYFASCTFF